MTKQTPAERLFTLTCCLVASPRIGLSKQDIYRAVAGYQQADSNEARDRMFERDKEALRNAGVQLEVLENDGFDETEQSRYRILKQSFDWPKELRLTPKKLQLLELAAKAWNNQLLEDSAQKGLTRLKSLGLVAKEQDLKPFSPRLLTRHAAFRPIASAIAESRLVTFRYQKPDGEATDRLVQPLKLRQLEGQWIALARHEGQIKNFLLRRIVGPVHVHDGEALPVSNIEVERAEKELADFVSGNLATLKVALDTEAATIFSPDESGIVTINYMDETLLAEDLLEYGVEVQVISPDSLKRKVRQSLKQVVKVHA